MKILRTARARGITALLAACVCVFVAFVILLGLLTEDWWYGLWVTSVTALLAVALWFALRFTLGAILKWIDAGERGSDAETAYLLGTASNADHLRRSLKQRGE